MNYVFRWPLHEDVSSVDTYLKFSIEVVSQNKNNLDKLTREGQT